MADEISVTTSQTTTAEGGSVSNRSRSYFADDGVAASLPKRYEFTATPTITYIVLFDATEEAWHTQLQSTAFVFIVNRDLSNEMILSIDNAGAELIKITLEPGRWFVLNVAKSDIDNDFTYAGQAITGIRCYSDSYSCKGEILTIYKP